MKATILFCALPIFIFWGCGSDKHPPYRLIEGLAQGTSYHITYEDKAGHDFSGAIDSIFKAFDLTFSGYVPNSLVSRINNNDTTAEVDDMFIDVYKKSLEINKETKGDFDITMGPLVNAWGFGPGKKTDTCLSRIDSLMRYIGMGKIRLNGKKLQKDLPGIKIDLNSIAQGYAVDVVYRYLEQQGIHDFLVEIGGEVRTKWKNPKGERWRIGIDKPTQGNMVPGENLQTIILLDNKAVTTSGNYRKFFEENGIKYSHIIDPHTGCPYKNNLLSVTVIAADALTADGYDTGLMVLGLKGARELLKQHPELQAYMVYADEEGKFQVEYTNGIRFGREE